MKLYKINSFALFLLGMAFTLSNSFGQVLTKTKKLEFSVISNATIELHSKYTNIEFELTDNNTVTIEAVMDIEGLSQKEAAAYFKKWELKANKKNNKLIISSILRNSTGTSLDKRGYYNGYFINGVQLDAIKLEKKVSLNKANTGKSLKENTKKFDYAAYIEQGDNYLLKWQKKHNEKIGKRWFNKTKEERILLQKAVKDDKPQKGKKTTAKARKSINSKEKLKARLKKNMLSKANVRSLPKRAIVNKTLKIKIPRHAYLNITVRHGKVIISDDIVNLKANLNYVLLQANTISGKNTFIKGAYTNFEINNWKAGRLDISFSDFALIKKVESITITSNASLVSIDNVTGNISAKGNFKMLGVDLSSTITYAKIDVEDSKKVWLKLPNSSYNLRYEGVDSKLIHPKKFSLKTVKNNSSKQLLENLPLKNNARFVKIKALASVLQIYDISWDDLEIKSLEGL